MKWDWRQVREENLLWLLLETGKGSRRTVNTEREVMNLRLLAEENHGRFGNVAGVRVENQWEEARKKEQIY